MRTGLHDFDPNDERLSDMRARVQSGRISQRVQVLRPPISDYLRHAFGYYHLSSEAGEDLRILDTDRVSDADLPEYDFVLLDDDTVIKLHYSSAEGSVIGWELLPDADVADFRRHRDWVLANSVPFLKYEEHLAR